MHIQQILHKRLSYFALFNIFMGLQAESIAQQNIQMEGIRAAQVFQRIGTSSNSEATIYLTPQNPANVGAHNRYRITVLNPDNSVDKVLPERDYIPGVPLDFSAYTNKSQRKVRVSFYKDGLEGLRWTSDLFSVGEVFIVAGQSNAASHGTIDGANVSADVNSFHAMVDPVAKTWLPLKEQMSFATTWTSDPPPAPPDTRVGSAWSSFADKLGTELNVPVAIINVAYTGTSVEQWLPNSLAPAGVNIFENRLVPAGKAVRTAFPDGTFHCSFRAVLWHQGEGNAHRNSVANPTTFPTLRTDYTHDLRSLAENFQTHTGCNQPWMVARVSFLSDWFWNGTLVGDRGKAESRIRRAQNYLPTRTAAASEPAFKPGPDTDVMAGFWGNGTHKYRPDGLHFRRKSLTLHGQLWADHVLRNLAPEPSNIPPEVRVPEFKAIWDLMGTTLQRTPDQINLDSDGVRYWVQFLAMQNLPDADVAAYAVAVIRPYMELSNEYKFRGYFNSTVTSRFPKVPTWSETNYYVGQLNDGRSEAQVKAMMQPETLLSGNTATAWNIFILTLNRAAPEINRESPEFISMVAALRTKSRATIEGELKAGDEYKIRAAFMSALVRQPTMAEVGQYKATLASNPALRSNPTGLADLVWQTPDQ